MKIFVGKSEELSSIAEKIISVEGSEVVLNVPKFSKLGESAMNFELLKREADAAEKKIVIESVDEHIIGVAESVGIEGYNPFFRRTDGRRTFSDIIPPARRSASRSSIESSDHSESDFAIDKVETKQKFERPKNKRRAYIIASVVIVVLAAFIAIKILPRAEVVVNIQKMDWEYSGLIKVDKSLASTDADVAAIPGALFSEPKNVQQSFPASGKKYVERKAKGVITIYNAFSSDPQPLVATTRFETPEGKVYRINKAITVPGAKIVDGKIEPSSIAANVTADKAGSQYNIGPVEKFSIPGFKGTPRFSGFYGSSAEPMDGGYIGEQAYPTEKDITNAKAAVNSALENALKLGFTQNIPDEFKFIDGSSDYHVLRQTVNEETDRDGNFTVFGEGERAALGFKESDLVDMLRERAKKDLYPDIVVNNYEITYGEGELGDGGNSLSFRVNFKAVFVRPIDENSLSSNLIGKNENDAQAVIYSLPGFESGSINFRPFWVKTVPNNAEKLKIIIQ